MDLNLKVKFEELFARYFPGAELPLTFYYANEPPAGMKAAPASKGWHCFVADLTTVRKGKSLCVDEPALGCGKRFCGFPVPQRPNFEYFLSCGIPGKMEGERYKKTPEIVKQMIEKWPDWQAPARYLVLKRWDKLVETDLPEAAVFFAKPDILSGLFTLANYEETDLFGVIAPFSAGCGTLIQYPFLENQKANPKCVLGMFDVSARPCVAADELTFAAPMKKITRMIANLEESFVITRSWDKVMRRLKNAGQE
ncbi:MAG: DUF169 domain-containing protein [Acidobacteriota bacterium]|jgi:hypothetical protein|nr:DUF169 domain-containing protein [Acidobacteriota bacterium]